MCRTLSGIVTINRLSVGTPRTWYLCSKIIDTPAGFFWIALNRFEFAGDIVTSWYKFTWDTKWPKYRGSSHSSEGELLASGQLANDASSTASCLATLLIGTRALEVIFTGWRSRRTNVLFAERWTSSSALQRWFCEIKKSYKDKIYCWKPLFRCEIVNKLEGFMQNDPEMK